MTYRSLDEGRAALLEQLHKVEKNRDVMQWAAANFEPDAFYEVSKFMNSRCLKTGRSSLWMAFRQQRG
jgi:hypothetical protein